MECAGNNPERGLEHGNPEVGYTCLVTIQQGFGQACLPSAKDKTLDFGCQ